MHDTPRPSDDTTIADQVPLETLIAELSAGDPSDAPEVADEIAVRLEADLAAASGRPHAAEVGLEAI